MKPLIQFKCPSCGDIFGREVAPDRGWILSYCDKSGRAAHCYKVKSDAEIEAQKNKRRIRNRRMNAKRRDSGYFKNWERTSLSRKESKKRRLNAKVKQQNRWRKMNREKYRIINGRAKRKASEQLKDHWLRVYLKDKFGIKNPTQNQIESCKRRLMIKRSQKLLQLMAAAAQLSSLSTLSKSK